MKLIINIPKEFIADYNKDRFKDTLQRAIVDSSGMLVGNYERETLEMLIKAFQEAEIVKENL